MKKSLLFLLAITLVSVLHTNAQVQIDHQIQMTGSGPNASVTGIKQVSDSSAATYARAIQNGALIYANDVGSANAFAVSFLPPITSYVAGMVVNFKAANANTGPATLSVNGLPADTIKKNFNANLASGDVQNGQLVSVMFDGAHFQMLSQLGNSSSPSSSPCSAVAGTASANPTSGACGFSTTLTLSGYNGLIQWQESGDGVNYSDIPGATSASFTDSVTLPSMHFIAKVSHGSCAVSYSNNVTTSPTGCLLKFCIAEGGYNDDEAESIVQTSDGGYAVAGYTNSFGAGGYDMYIVKFDSSANVLWTRTVGGSNDDQAYSIVQTTDGGYAVAGYTQSFGAGSYDMYIVKLDASGNVSWTQTVGGSNVDWAYSIVQTSDGGYAVAGYTYSFGYNAGNVYIAKLDGSGNISWTKTVGGSSAQNQAQAIVQTSDGGYAVAGYAFGAGNDVYVIKLDVSGNVTWAKTVGGSSQDYGFSIIQTTDGGYAVAGYTISFGAGGQDFYIVKLDGSGNLTWTATVGGPNNEAAYSIVQSTDGGYLVAGNTSSFDENGNGDVYIVKLDASGNLLWTKTAGGTSSDGASSIIRTSDGGYAVAGNTGSFGSGSNDLYIIKLDANGNGCCTNNPVAPSTSSGGTLGSGSTTTGSNFGASGTGGSNGTGGTLTTICN